VTCRDFVNCVIDYQDGELDAHTRARFHQHLAVCRDCPSYLTQYCETIQASAAAYTEMALEIPEDLVGAILASSR
jgi:anti-sigma factor RsiW